jgi:hypothetical protein
MYIFSDVIGSIRKFKIREYVSSAWNLIDWAHFCVMWLGWVAWLRQVLLIYRLPMKTSYPILVSPGSTTQARAFLTNPVAERDFLILNDDINQLMQNISTYNTLTSLAGASFCILWCLLLTFNISNALHHVSLMV